MNEEYFKLNESIENLENFFEVKTFLNWFFIEYIDDKNLEKTNKKPFFCNVFCGTLYGISRKINSLDVFHRNLNNLINNKQKSINSVGVELVKEQFFYRQSFY